MKRVLFRDERLKLKQHAFHPSAFILLPCSLLAVLTV